MMSVCEIKSVADDHEPFAEILCNALDNSIIFVANIMPVKAPEGD